MPWLGVIWTKNPVLEHFRSVRASPIVAFGTSRIQRRKEENASCLNPHKGAGTEDRRDFLARFLDISDSSPEIPDFAVTAWVTSNVTAGSDTTAILLRTLFYHLITHPKTNWISCAWKSMKLGK